MNQQIRTTAIRRERLARLLQTAVLLALMVLVFGWLGVHAFGGRLFLIFLGMLVVSILFSSAASPRRVLGRGVYPVSRNQAPEIYAILAELARRAGLEFAPQLYYTPSGTPNAVTVGTGDQTAIVVTRGLLDRLSRPELAGVLAHEVAHIANNDVRLLTLAESMRLATTLLSKVGQFMLLITLPLFLIAGEPLPIGFLLLTIFAPLISVLLHLALMRAREFEADLTAVKLTGDPRALARALQRLNVASRGFLELLFPVPMRDEFSLFRTHPATAERVRRLMRLAR